MEGGKGVVHGSTTPPPPPHTHTHTPLTGEGNTTSTTTGHAYSLRKVWPSQGCCKLWRLLVLLIQVWHRLGLKWLKELRISDMLSYADHCRAKAVTFLARVQSRCQRHALPVGTHRRYTIAAVARWCTVTASGKIRQTFRLDLAHPLCTAIDIKQQSKEITAKQGNRTHIGLQAPSQRCGRCQRS